MKHSRPSRLRILAPSSSKPLKSSSPYLYKVFTLSRQFATISNEQKLFGVRTRELKAHIERDPKFRHLRNNEEALMYMLKELEKAGLIYFTSFDQVKPVT